LNGEDFVLLHVYYKFCCVIVWITILYTVSTSVHVMILSA